MKQYTGISTFALEMYGKLEALSETVMMALLRDNVI
jgi:hypothetical protein